MTVHDQLRSLLLSVRRRWRAEVVLRAIGRGAACAAVPVLVGAGVAALLTPGDTALMVLAVTIVLAALMALAVTPWRFGRRPGDRQVARFPSDRQVARFPSDREVARFPSDLQVARFIEERAARMDDVVPFEDVMVSAVEALASPEPEPFGGLVVESAVRRFDAIGAAGIVTARALRRASAEAVAGVGTLAVATALAWPMLARASEAAWITLFPQSIQVEVLPGDARLPAGQPLTIRASVRAGGQLLTRLTPRLTVEAGTDARTVAMSPDGGGFLFSFESIDRSFLYRVTAGSRRSNDYTVTALVGARVARIDLRYEYPAFANLPPREERDAGDIYAPAGTRVHVRIHTDKPIASGQMVFALGADGRSVAESGGLRATGDQVLEGELILARDDSYRVRLTDRDGLRTSGETEYFLRVMDDRPPDVRILRPAADQQITPLEEVAIEARAEDDYGISRFELVYVVAGREPKVLPFAPAAGNPLTRAGTHTLAAEDLGVQPGDVITYYARARDVGRGKPPTESRSDMFFLEVRPFSEEFVLAESQAMSGMASEQIETLVAAQKEIINATWNIERRVASGAGRSATDVTAIAEAQAELRRRAEQIGSRAGRGRGVIRFPQQPPPPQRQAQGGPTRQIQGRPIRQAQGRPIRQAQGRPVRQAQGRPSSDPVSTAISAMTRAIDQLEGQRTGLALPHEMAALQGLVQAAAEVRRREVAQQAGASMGGLGRQGQDLSALFDKELQRQQRTNYETRSQSDARADRQDGESALDRIRDLAQRQEELARRQRELASASVSAEELQRQLEKLTREQEALRQQTDELSRQMGQPASQPQRGGAARQNQAGGSAMRDASDEMRIAAGELQRQSPSTAARRGERAAADLRRLEQQMRRDSPEAQRQAAGEARLEAQQIADEQRRIADEAARLAKGADHANRDAWRRLSGEKETLADRVDALQRAAEQLETPGPSSPQGKRGPSASVAQEIAREQIAGRMRETARQMRDAPGSEVAAGRAAQPAPVRGAADAEQQIARALDRIVDQLGGGSADAADLSRALDQSRAIRDRLDRLERQMREADARGAAGRQGQGPASIRSGQGPSASAGQGPSTSSGQGRATGGGTGTSPGTGEEAQRLRDQYAKELQGARESLSRLERSSPGPGLGGGSPEEHEWSGVDKGTEAFKQDFSTWASLRKDVDSALDRYEASVVARAARKGLQDRLSAGGSDRVPDDYRRLIARYYESLARKK